MARFYDTTAVMQVIGNIYLNPNLLDMTDRYNFNEEDFNVEPFHKILFGSIYNLFYLGAKQINNQTIEDYLNSRPNKLAVYKQNRGGEYLDKLVQDAQPQAFDFYYSRLKKMTLLRMYAETVGMDLQWLYDINNILDMRKKQRQEEWLDNHTLQEIVDEINEKIDDIRLKFAENVQDDFVDAGDGIEDLLERLASTPEIGYPLYGPLVNAVHRGARLKKFYLRSAATGVGKTRAMIADAGYIGCSEIYNVERGCWESSGPAEPTIFIATEQEIEELQTMLLAFLSAVDEENILTGAYLRSEDETARVHKAIKLLKNSKLHLKQLPDFSLQDIENTIKWAIREWGCKYILFDYIHSSMKILSEVSSKTGVRGLREDNILFMISVRLKDLCNEYGVFILTSTQLNADYVTAQQYDQNLLRGAKSIADKIDMGAIMLQTSNEDLEALKEVLLKGGFPNPQIKMSIYKNRRGKYKDILLWCKANRGICRIEPMFVTNYNYELIDIEDLKILVEEDVTAQDNKMIF